MLEKKVPFCIDHFSIATTHRDRPIDLVTKLGFTTADCYTDRTVHFIFENSYFELCTYQLNTTITWLTQSVPATNLPKVHSYRLSVKGTDPNPMRNALIEGGIETIGEINNPFRQHVRYGEKEGEAGYQTFFIQNYEPFTDILFGCTTHLAKELIVKNETKFPTSTAPSAWPTSPATATARSALRRPTPPSPSSTTPPRGPLTPASTWTPISWWITTPTWPSSAASPATTA